MGIYRCTHEKRYLVFIQQKFFISFHAAEITSLFVSRTSNCSDDSFHSLQMHRKASHIMFQLSPLIVSIYWFLPHCLQLIWLISCATMISNFPSTSFKLWSRLRAGRWMTKHFQGRGWNLFIVLYVIYLIMKQQQLKHRQWAMTKSDHENLISQIQAWFWSTEFVEMGCVLSM